MISVLLFELLTLHVVSGADKNESEPNALSGVDQPKAPGKQSFVSASQGDPGGRDGRGLFWWAHTLCKKGKSYFAFASVDKHRVLYEGHIDLEKRV